MKLKVAERILKNWLVRAEISLNRRFEREYIPADNQTLCIETSSACNLKCRFCAYVKKPGPRISMPNDLFAHCVEQALEMGYREFHLTPCTGDVFMDKQLFEKLEYMDGNPGVRAYHFFTNLTVPDEQQLIRLTTLKKLSRMTVSVYGHDEESFIALADSSARIYRRLLANLETLLGLRDSWPFNLSIGFRSTFHVPTDESSDLLRLLGLFRKAGVGIHSSHGIYNNWGGSITQQDVGDLDILILSSENVYKSGACVKLFDSFQITASGIVNGCSCRDAQTTLKIGDARQTPLRDILSKNNPDYLRIIANQQEGKFNEVCRHCDFYRSIYHQPSNMRKNKTPVITMTEFLDRLDESATRIRTKR